MRHLSNSQFSDERIVIGTIPALATANRCAPAIRNPVEHMVEAHDAECRSSIRRTWSRQAPRQFCVCGVVVSEPRVEVASDDRWRAEVESRRERPCLTEARRLRGGPEMMTDRVGEMRGDGTARMGPWVAVGGGRCGDRDGPVM